MNKGKYVFSQLLDFLDKDVFLRISNKYNGNRYVKSFTWIHVRQYWECLAASVVLWFLLHVGAALLGGHVSAWWLLFVPTTFYLLYGVEWLISYVYHILQGDARDRWNDAAYHASAFEMEAYAHEAEANYLSSRRWFAFVKYYGKL